MWTCEELAEAHDQWRAQFDSRVLNMTLIAYNMPLTVAEAPWRAGHRAWPTALSSGALRRVVEGYVETNTVSCS